MNSLKIDNEMISELIAPLITKKQKRAVKEGVIPSGIESVDDRLLGGLRRGQAHLIRGVDWIGKMSFALNIIANQFSNKDYTTKVLFVTGAHDISSILLRLVCITANVPSIGISGEYSAEDILKVKQAAKVVANSGIEFFSPSFAEDLRLHCFAMKPDFIIFDRPLSGTEQMPGTFFSTLAKESDAVVLVLEDISEKVAMAFREHKEPEKIMETALSEDRNMDSFAQFFIHRDSFYEHLEKDRDLYDFFVLYYDGVMSSDAVCCLRSWGSEKIISCTADQGGGIK